MMLDIDREWSQPPGWSMRLTSGEQATLIGLRRARQPRPGAGAAPGAPPRPGGHRGGGR